MTTQEPKKRGRKPKHNKDYTKEYEAHLRCPNCKQETEGVEDYQNFKTGKLTKTCITCRTKVLKSLNKIKLPTNKERIKAYEEILKLIHKDIIRQAIKDKEHLNKYILSI
jgi:hypothetical protein